MAKKTTPAAESNAEVAHGGKSDIIRAILDSGISKPAAIMEEARTKYNVEVASGLINSVKQKHLGKSKKGEKTAGQSNAMLQILNLHRDLTHIGGSDVALQAITLTEKFIAEFGSIEDARIAIESLEKLKAQLK